MLYSCEEHIDIALDEQVDESGLPPELNKIANSAQLSTPCTFCKEPAIYVVNN